jgi:hypothetical protein
VRVPEVVPKAGGVKTTLIEQVPPAAKVLGASGQLFVWLKFALALIELMVKGMFWTFFSVMVFAELLFPNVMLPKERLPGESPTGLTPVPLRGTAREEGVPESVTVSVPEMAPTAAGVNVKEIVQDLPAARDEPQVVLLTANGPPVPVVMPVMEMAAVVLLATVAFFAVLVLLTAILPKERLAGETDTWPCATLAQIRTARTAQSFIAAGTKLDLVFADDVDVGNP